MAELVRNPGQRHPPQRQREISASGAADQSQRNSDQRCADERSVGPDHTAAAVRFEMVLQPDRHVREGTGIGPARVQLAQPVLGGLVGTHRFLERGPAIHIEATDPRAGQARPLRKLHLLRSLHPVRRLDEHPVQAAEGRPRADGSDRRPVRSNQQRSGQVRVARALSGADPLARRSLPVRWRSACRSAAAAGLRSASTATARGGDAAVATGAASASATCSGRARRAR